MSVKVGFNQFGKPAPLAYKRFVTMLIVFVVPATATYIVNIPVEILTDNAKVFIGITATYILSILKGFEFFLGEDSQPEKEDK